MCAGIALALSELPLALIEQHGLKPCVHERGGEQEVRFLYRTRQPRLPVWLDGQLEILRWGSRDRRCALPYTGWTWQATVEAGRWAAWHAEPVVIPATLGLDGGIWYRIRQGVQGLVVRNQEEEPIVYMLVETASHYYEVMTRAKRMPVLLGERI